jgi:hypothetical protein
MDRESLAWTHRAMITPIVRTPHGISTNHAYAMHKAFRKTMHKILRREIDSDRAGGDAGTPAPPIRAWAPRRAR